MKKVKADLHIHINGRATKEHFIGYLKKAEADGVKKLCLLEHDKLTNVELIENLLKNNELQHYYTGELIVGVEYNAILDAHHTNSDGSNYDGYTCHFLTYMSYDDAKKMKKNARLYGRNEFEDYKKDYDSLMAKLSLAMKMSGQDAEMPSIEDLRAMKTPHIVKDLHAWIVESGERVEKYSAILNLTQEHIASPSVFIRSLAQAPDGILYYMPVAIPTLTELLSIIRSTAPSAKVVVAHPAYMSQDFDTLSYLDSLMSMPCVAGKCNFDGIEANYYFNTAGENEMLNKYADERGLLKTAGTDSITYTGKIQRYSVDGNVYFFEPQFGKAMGLAYYSGHVKTTKDGDVCYIEYADDYSTLEVDENLFSDISIDLRNKRQEKNLDREF